MVSKAGGYHAPPLQVFTWSDVERPPLSHNFKFPCGCCRVTLGYSGNRGGDRRRGPGVVDTTPGRIFLCQQQPEHVDAGRPATTGL